MLTLYQNITYLKMIKKILFLFAIVLKFQTAFSQCDDGWFTGKMSLGYGFNKLIFSDFSYIYNLENHLSFGSSTTFMMEEKKFKCSFLGDLRLRPFGKKILTPALWLSTGYMLKERCLVLSPKIAFESGKLIPLRPVFEIGGYFFNKKNILTLSLAAEF